jgi:hypothetical protein
MTKKARKLSVYLSLVITPLGLGTLALSRHASLAGQPHGFVATEATDAAYRDGLFLGRLDAQEGRKVTLSVGRWNTEQDRAAFKAGYLSGYRGAVAAKLAEHRH